MAYDNELPEGWDRYRDPETNQDWYWHQGLKISSKAHPSIFDLRVRVSQLESTIKDLQNLGQYMLKEMERLGAKDEQTIPMVITPQPHRPQGDQGPLAFFPKSPPPSVVPWAPQWHPQAPLPQAPGGMIPKVPSCAWHGKGNAPPAGSFVGIREEYLDSWSSHLKSTIGYTVMDSSTLDSAYFFFRKYWQHLVVTGCRTSCHRAFHIECVHCRHACFAEYGHGNTLNQEAASIAAIEALAQFSLVTSDPEKREV